jgi:hypothetical protein
MQFVLETVLILFCLCEENEEVYEITMLSLPPKKVLNQLVYCLTL